ncbi:MAG: HK97 family phage prohead protease, partial [Clostridia bacterium]|nr:HK97 family phage prohead protease [Clostridia bacterium]
EVIKKARAGELVGWSFGFEDRDVEKREKDGMPYRAVKDLDLYEVSILDKTKSPAYEGTLIAARADDAPYNVSETMPFECTVTETETRDETPVEDNTIDYTKYIKIIEEMKGEK